MSQPCVERVIGMLATDEGLRRRFLRGPEAALKEAMERGMELTVFEQRSLASLDPKALAGFVKAIDPRLQKTDLRESAS